MEARQLRGIVLPNDIRNCIRLLIGYVHLPRGFDRPRLLLRCEAFRISRLREVEYAIVGLVDRVRQSSRLLWVCKSGRKCWLNVLVRLDLACGGIHLGIER